jgi:4-hydroxybenzoyl-CoA thioesterase
VTSHRFPLTIRFGDLDPAGMVYYPRTLHFCHVGMEEFFRQVVGVDYPTFTGEHHLGLPTVRSEVDYRRPLRYGDTLEIEIAVAKVGRSSVAWHDRIRHEGSDRPSAEIHLTTVLVDMRTFTKVPVPDWLRAKLS